MGWKEIPKSTGELGQQIQRGNLNTRQIADLVRNIPATTSVEANRIVVPQVVKKNRWSIQQAGPEQLRQAGFTTHENPQNPTNSLPNSKLGFWGWLRGNGRG